MRSRRPIAAKLKMRAVQPKLGRRRIVLEGGSIDVNGAGLILTTEECLLSDVQATESRTDSRGLREASSPTTSASEKTIWLQRGIAGDDTHGHVDDLARFVSPETVVLAVERDQNEANFEPLQENLRLLKRMPGDPSGHRCRCRSRSTSGASDCRPVTPTSTLQMGWC